MRSKFSQAIHRSMKRQLDSWKATGKIGRQEVKDTDEAVKLAAQNAYSRVKINPGPSDTPTRSK